MFLTKNYWPLAVYSSIFRHLLHVRPSLYKHVSAQLQLDEFPWTFLLVTFTKIRRETPNLEVPDTLYEYLITFSFARRHKFAIHNFCATINCRRCYGVQQHTEKTLLLFHCYNGHTQAPQCYFIPTSTLPTIRDTISAVNTQYTSNKCPVLTQALLAGTLYHRPAQTTATAQHEMRQVLLNISLGKPRSNSEAILKPYHLCTYCNISNQMSHY